MSRFVDEQAQPSAVEIRLEQSVHDLLPAMFVIGKGSRGVEGWAHGVGF